MNGQLGYEEIQKMIKQELSKSDFALIKIGVVVSYSAPNAVLKLAGSNTNITLPNKTGLTLVANDRVAVVQMRGDATNSFIGWKM